MGLVQDVENKVGDFVFHKALGRAAMVVAQAAASLALAHAGVLQSAGVSISVDPNVVAGAILGGVHLLAQWLASKSPKLSFLAAL